MALRKAVQRLILIRALLLGANIDAKSGIGYTPLHAAAKEGRSDVRVSLPL